MARRGKPTIRITADADGVKRGTQEAERHLSRMEKSGSRSLSRLKGAGAAAGVGLLGGAVVGLKASADAAIEAEKTQARLEAQLKASGTTFEKHRGEIEKVIAAHSRLSGLDDEDLTDAFTNIVRTTKDVDKSLRLTGLAADFARAKHIDVAKAGDIVGKVAGGNTGILSRYGITLKEGASAGEALAAMQKRFAGQAESYGKTTAGSIDRMHVGAENLAETVGEKLAPHLATAADGLSKFIGEMEDGTGAGGEFADIAGDVANVVGDIGKFLKDHPALVATAAGAWVTYKVLSMAALTAMKVQDFRKAFGKGKGAAAVEGAIAGKTYSAAFDTAAQDGVGKMGRAGSKWRTALRGLGLASGTLVGAGLAAAALVEAADALGLDPDAIVIDNAAGKPSPNYSTGRGGGAGGGNRNGSGGNGNPTPGANSRGPNTDNPVTSRGPNTGSTKAMTSSRSGMMVPARGGSGGVARTSAASPPPLAQYLVRMFALRYTSGYRTPERNAAVGGVDGSWHTKGSAARPGAIDLVGSMEGMKAALAWARKNVPGLAEAMIHDAGSGLHLHLAGNGVMNWTSAGSQPRSGGGSTPAASAPERDTGLPSGTPYATEIERAARKYGISPALLAGLIKQESKFDPKAKSGAGAMGLTQLMPGTARGLGVTDPFNPAQSINGGAKYLAQMLRKYDGNVALALAAYNAGPGNVDKYGGIPPFAETQNYVKAVTANAQGFGGGQAAERSLEQWKMTPARRHALRLARAESAEALAATTGIPSDDIAAQRRLVSVKQRRIAQIDRALRGRPNPDKRAELIAERSQLVGEVAGHRDGIVDRRLDDGFDLRMARVGVSQANAETTAGTNDDVVALYAEAVTKEQRLKAVNRQLRRKLTPAKRTELLNEKAGLISELGGIRGRYDEIMAPPDAGDQPTQYDYLGAEMVKAELAGQDTRPILERIRTARQADYDAALLTADPRDDIETGGLLREVIAALGQIADNTAQQLDLTKAELEKTRRELNVSQAQYRTAGRALGGVPSVPGRYLAGVGRL